VRYVPPVYPPRTDTVTAWGPDAVPDAEFCAVRPGLPPVSLASGVRRIIHEVDSKLLMTQFGVLEGLVNASMARARITMVLLLVAAATALSLGVIGLYGVLSYAVSQRVAELGVRIALGASPATVVRMVVSEGALLAVAGIGVGALAALALPRYLRAPLYAVTRT